MAEAQFLHQKVLASFLQTIANEEGWWYRVPKGKIRTKDDPPIPQDVIMPQFGSVFGLTEEATCVIFTEMGLLNHNTKKDSYSIRRKGWDDLGSLFSVDHLLELKPTKFSNTEHMYVRLGVVPTHALFPARIWNEYKSKNKSIILPKAIGNRRTTSFVTQELVGIIKSSKLFPKLVQMRYFGSEQESIIDRQRIGTNMRHIQAGLDQDTLTEQRVTELHVV